MVALVFVCGLLTVAVAIVEGSKEFFAWAKGKHEDHKLFKRNRQEMRFYY